MKPDGRRERIVERTRERETISVEELAKWLRVSRETIRRDLTVLATEGRIRKVHGGATLPPIHREGRFSERLKEAVQQKNAIAATAARLFSTSSTMFIDVGTTTLTFAEAIAGRTHLTVITNGLEIARLLAHSGVRTYLVGGELNSDAAETIGPLAVDQISRFHAEHAVISVAGLTARGAMDFQLDEAQIAREMINHARSVTVLANGAKLGRDALFRVCTLAEIDRIVTDDVPGLLADDLRAAGVEVVIARTDGLAL